MSAPTIPTNPLLRWIEVEIVPRYGSQAALCQILAERTNIKPKSWQRQLTRLAQREQISLYVADRICILLGAHISQFQEPQP